MMKFKGCQRCGGDVAIEEMHGEIELVCLQCGRRTYATHHPAALRGLHRGRPGVQRTRAA